MAVNEVEIESSFASSMGARSRVSVPGCGMYLVIGNSKSLDSVVRTAGGECVLRLNGGKALVKLPFTGYLSLQGNREISKIGPVTVDLNRLSKIAGMLGKGK